VLTDTSASTAAVCQPVNTKEESSLPDSPSPASSDALRPNKRKKKLLRCVAQLETSLLAHRGDNDSISREDSQFEHLTKYCLDEVI
jgi:hypothetical protein